MVIDSKRLLHHEMLLTLLFYADTVDPTKFDNVSAQFRRSFRLFSFQSDSMPACFLKCVGSSIAAFGVLIINVSLRAVVRELTFLARSPRRRFALEGASADRAVPEHRVFGGRHRFSKRSRRCLSVIRLGFSFGEKTYCAANDRRKELTKAVRPAMP